PASGRGPSAEDIGVRLAVDDEVALHHVLSVPLPEIIGVGRTPGVDPGEDSALSRGVGTDEHGERREADGGAPKAPEVLEARALEHAPNIARTRARRAHNGCWAAER